jgi:hypothetical protein
MIAQYTHRLIFAYVAINSKTIIKHHKTSLFRVQNRVHAFLFYYKTLFQNRVHHRLSNRDIDVRFSSSTMATYGFMALKSE